jgi:predicted KAP-like P-loop ATPase
VALERAVLDRRGEVDVFAAAVIQSAMRWERHALLAQKWLRITPDLDPDQKLAFSREIARASSERDKCLRLLGLDVRASANVLDTFYSGIGAGEGPEGDHEANGPTGATPEADTGPGDGCEVPSAN